MAQPRKAKAKETRTALESGPGAVQRVLPGLGDDGTEEVVVVTSAGRPLAAIPPPVASRLLEDSAAAGVRPTLLHALYRDLGQPGSMLDSPKGLSFALRPVGPEGGGVGGEARSPHPLTVPLPGGRVTAHEADLAIELENGAVLVLDVLASTESLEQVKAHAFDALQLRQVDRLFAVLVFVRCGGGLEQEQAEALGHGYDHVFGLPEEQVRSDTGYGALRARIASWLRAASTG